MAMEARKITTEFPADSLPAAQGGFGLKGSWTNATDAQGKHSLTVSATLAGPVGKEANNKGTYAVAWATGGATPKAKAGDKKKKMGKKGVEAATCGWFTYANKGGFGHNGAFFPATTLAQWSAPAFDPQMAVFQNEAKWKNNAKGTKFAADGQSITIVNTRSYDPPRGLNYKKSIGFNIGFTAAGSNGNCSGNIKGPCTGMSKEISIKLVSGATLGTAAASAALASYLMF